MPTKYKTFPRIVPLTRSNFVGKELIRRKNNTFGENASPRSVWVRAVSNAVQVKSDGEQIEDIKGSLNVLVGGLLSTKFYTRGSFETLYRRPGRQIQDMPIPGIESISITSKGDMHSLRKVTINWSCPNLEDLDTLAPFWLTPGISVWLEWGWSMLNKQPIPVDMNNVGKLKTYYENAENIYDDIIITSEGNHDAYMGVITNFSFNENDDRSWSCTTELTALGQTLISTDINKDITSPGSSGDKNAIKYETIKEFIKDKLTEGDILNLPAPVTATDLKGRGLYGTWKSYGDVLQLTKDNFLFDYEKTFVSWRFIEHQIINTHLALKFRGSGGSGTLFKFDSIGIEISNDPMLYSTDIKTGLIVHKKGNGAFKFDVGGEGDSQNLNPYAGYMSRLYFNTTFVTEVFEKSEKLDEAIMNLLNGMSAACADMWKFKIQPDPIRENIVQIIDLNYVSNDDLNELEASIKDDVESNDKIMSFGGLSGKSVLSSVSFTSKLTDQIALKYFVSRNKSKKTNSQIVMNDDNDGGAQEIFGSFEDRILRNIEPPEEIILTEDEQAKLFKEQKEEDEAQKEFNISVDKLRTALENGTPIENIETDWPSNIIILEESGKTLIVDYINRKYIDKGKNIENKIRYRPIYPLEISVTIDGISGILPGHCFIVDSVPRIYRNRGVFQVVEVGHEISGDDWATNLRCFFRYTVKPTSPLFDPQKRETEVEGESINDTTG